MKKRLGFKENPKIIFKQDEANAKKTLGQTGYYDPQEKSITIFTTGRHEKDILRSMCHEIVHHSQNCQGKLRNIDMELIKDDYAQKNEQLRELEREAYEQGNLGLRDWEDSIKQGDDMKTDKAKEKLLEKIRKDREVPSYIKSRNQKKAELTWERYGFSLPKAEAGLLEDSKKEEKK